MNIKEDIDRGGTKREESFFAKSKPCTVNILTIDYLLTFMTDVPDEKLIKTIKKSELEQIELISSHYYIKYISFNA